MQHLVRSIEWREIKNGAGLQKTAGLEEGSVLNKDSPPVQEHVHVVSGRRVWRLRQVHVLHRPQDLRAREL